MPYAPATLRPRHVARQLAEKDYDARRGKKPWRAWYKTTAWQAIRKAQLHVEPLCRMCVEDDRVTGATVCDHVEPHRGDRPRFFAGPFQSLCETCHNSRKQKAERAGR